MTTQTMPKQRSRQFVEKVNVSPAMENFMDDITWMNLLCGYYVASSSSMSLSAEPRPKKVKQVANQHDTNNVAEKRVTKFSFFTTNWER